MVFLTAGLGGGTGTGATPILANLAAEMDVLVIAIVTLPFEFEGKVRARQAEEGLHELKNVVDTVIAIPNERLLQTVNLNTTIQDAFKMADDILRQAAQGISDLITKPGLINLDFADVKSIMKGMGMAFMGTGIASGDEQGRRSRPEGHLEPAPRRHVDRRRPRGPHQHHRRQGHHPARGLQGLPAHPQPGPSGRQHHLRDGRRPGHEGDGQGHGHRHRLRDGRIGRGRGATDDFVAVAAEPRRRPPSRFTRRLRPTSSSPRATPPPPGSRPPGKTSGRASRRLRSSGGPSTPPMRKSTHDVS